MAKVLITIKWPDGRIEKVREYSHWLKDKEIKQYLDSAKKSGAKVTVEKG